MRYLDLDRDLELIPDAAQSIRTASRTRHPLSASAAAQLVARGREIDHASALHLPQSEHGGGR